MPAPNLFLIYVTDVRRATDFYRDLFDIEPAMETPRYVPFEVAPGVLFALYAATVPTYLQMLGAMSKLLDKAEAWCADNAHAIRANLLASAQATTFECRLASIERTHSASGPALLATLCM